MHACPRSRPALRFLLLLALSFSFLPSAAPARAQTAEKVVAHVNGRPITQQQVDDTIAAQLRPLQEQIDALRRKALENLVVRAVLEDEAKRKGVSVEGLRKSLTAGAVKVSPGEVEQLYLENAAAFSAMSPDEAREKLRLDLESQARMRLYREAVQRLRAASSVELRMDEPGRLTVGGLDAAPSRGPRAAPVTVVEFSDFQCHYCQEARATVERVLREYEGRVRLVFKHLPLTDTHPQALPAARAAYCAGRQGSFWPYHDALFSSAELSPAAFDEIAARLRLRLGEFRTCLASEESRAAVIEDAREARRLGIAGTPAFVVNGQLLRGAVGFDEFKAVIERELKSARGHSPPP